MAWTKAASSKGAAAMHARHVKGNLTANQLAAARRNLSKARASKHRRHGGGIHHNYHRKGFKFPRGAQKPVARGNSAARRIKENNYFTLRAKAPLGTRRFAYHGKVQQHVHKSTGINRKLSTIIGPGGYGRRTRWARANKHHIKKVLRPRAVRGVRVKHWRYSNRTRTPR